MILMIYVKFPSQFNFICLGITFNVMAKSGPSSNKKRTGRIRYEGSSDSKKFLPIAENYHQSTSRTVFSCLYAFRENLKKMIWAERVFIFLQGPYSPNRPRLLSPTSSVIKGDLMIFRLCENQHSAHCFLGEHRPFSSRFSLYLYLALFLFSLQSGAVQLHWPSIKWVAK